ncbi:MAG: twin-arginine translocation signal domain-containing protein, partial [Actinomycetota bacterium]|nr:twin-arginine translocation signal domain-containing protein [Actinomycetota bacterium]
MSSRRGFLAAAGGTTLAAGLLGACTTQDHSEHSPGAVEMSGGHGPMSGVRGATFRSGGRVDHAANGFDPRVLLRDFDYGQTSIGADGRTVRE